MDKYRKIAELLKGFQHSGQSFFSATVESVEGLTCTVKVDNLSIPNIRLKPTNENTDDKILLTPAIKSNVLVGSFSGDLSNLFVLQADSISEAFLKIGETTFKLNENGVEVNGGENSGVVKVDELISWMNNVKVDFTTISTALNSLGVPVAILTQNPIKSKIENSKFTH